MNRKISKYVSMAAVFALFSTAVSCDKTDEASEISEISYESVAVESVDTKDTYKASSLTLPSEVSYIMQLCTNESNIFVAAIDEEENRVIYRSDYDCSEYLPYSTAEYPKDGGLWMSASEDGRLFVLSVVKTYEGLPEPDYDDPDMDWEMYNEACVCEYTIDTYNADGTVEASVRVTGLDEKLTGYDSSPMHLQAAENGFVIVFGTTAVRCGVDGAVSKTAELAEEQLMYCGSSADGKIICTSYGGNENNQFFTVDAETLEISQMSEGGKGYINKIAAGKGGYSAFFGFGDGIYGYENGKLVFLLDWQNAGISNPREFVAVSEERFIVADLGSVEGSKVTLLDVQPRSEEELYELEVITLANYGSDLEIEQHVQEFNRDYDGRYMIKFAENYAEKYGSSNVNSDKKGMAEVINRAIIAGDIPDLICCHEYPVLQNLAAKGAFTDIYQLLENDPDLSKEDFLPNILEANEYGGKLSIMPYSFTVMTLAAKEKYTCGAGENWTAQQMLDAVGNMPEGMAVTRSRDSEVFMYDLFFQTSAGFIDYENRTCRFDSPEFIALLQLAKDGPFMEGLDDPDLSEQEVVDMLNNGMVYDKSLVQSGAGTYSAYKELQEKCGEDKITLVGYPSEDGKGAGLRFGSAFGIFEQSEHKEGAWEFVKFYLSDSMQQGFMDGKGKSLGEGNSVLEKYNPREDEYYSDYIRSVDRVFAYDYDIFDIIMEEAEYLFNGEHTAEQTADLIQNRVSILISEQSW